MSFPPSASLLRWVTCFRVNGAESRGMDAEIDTHQSQYTYQALSVSPEILVLPENES